MSDEEFRLDNPMLVRWEFASEERLEKRNALLKRLVEGIDAEEVLFGAVKEFAPKRVLEVGCGLDSLANHWDRAQHFVIVEPGRTFADNAEVPFAEELVFHVDDGAALDGSDAR